MTRFEKMQLLLNQGKYFKLVCGAGNENAEEVKKLAILYTLAGAKGLDISANTEVIKSCMEGIEYAFQISSKIGVNIKTKPFITVSIGMKGDHHVRKAKIDLIKCITCNLCIPTCPTNAIPKELVIIQEKCIGCGNCGAICPKDDVITYHHNAKDLINILPKCKELGVEHFELHAAVADDDSIMDEWKILNEVNQDNHISMCLDRLHLSDFGLEKRIQKAKEIAGERLIIQADGYPMSGGENDFNTTLQAVAIADIINKRFNKKINKKSKKSVYKKPNNINILLSGGTNSVTTVLAKQNNVKYQGVSIGTFARNIVKDIINNYDFYKNPNYIKQGYQIAKKLVIANVGEIHE